METRTEELEIEVKAATAQTTTQGQQISDIQWKLEDAENRQRRNNLRILGIAEDLEGQDTRAYIVSLFKQAFPDLNGWDWEKEIQRAHRFPLMKKKQALTATNRDQSYPRPIIVYFGNFLLRQAVFEKARPNSKVTVEGVSFFSRPDFAYATVERRWRLRQMIAQFQELGAEAYLLSPARLKIRAFLLTSMTQGWHTDKIKLMEVSRHPTSCGIKNLMRWNPRWWPVVPADSHRPLRPILRQQRLLHTHRVCRMPATRTDAASEPRSLGGVQQDQRRVDKRQSVPRRKLGAGLGPESCGATGDMACNTSMPPPMDGPAETPLLDLIYRTMVHNHEQAQKESRKSEIGK
ncbi:hypothetical protein NDU88_002279 [Pleurodeles waltl]|uniref:Uncharacterized protein n=1 Tax=Pleurodeles waltl TaxID=8319 RepID=A0AAV7MM67_PLEWA|nr:hypothetical protein NDU88_002279 [Pleurodeles waltl]